MFNVHRFHIDDIDDRDGGEDDQGSSKLQQKEKILSDLLERARSRAKKRPRVAKGEGTSEESPPNNAHDRTGLASPPRLRPFASVETAKGTKFAGTDPDGKRSQRLKGGRRLVAPRRRDAALPRDAGDAKAREVAEAEQADNEGKQDGLGRQGEEGEETASEGPDIAAAAGNVEVEADARRLQGNNRKPVEEVAKQWGLDARLTATLSEEGVKRFFPIQIQVIPDIVATERHSHVQSRDICVCAPTGSGKTLVFVLGVLQALIRRRVIRLRALVLLPSRDLAVQVHRVFQRYARGTGLRVGLAIGQTNFLEEQLALVGAAALAGNPVATARATCLHVQDGHASSDQKDDLRFGRIGRGVTARVPTGGSSQVDVVVATPGRLLDHLEKTPGFTLQHLRYLVIDEADRLFNQSYHGWVGKVIKAAYRREPGIATPLYYSGGFTGESEGVVRGEDLLPEGLRLEPATVRGRPLATGDRVRGPTVSTPPLRKLLFSATLTSNPQKLAGLDVVNPIVYTAREAMIPFSGGGVVSDDREGGSEDGERVGSKKREAGLLSQETRRSNLDHAGATGDEGEGWFSTPATLVETYTVCEAQAKPLVLIALLRDAIKRRDGLSVVFTSSVDSTHRLFRLLQLFGGFNSDGVLERWSDVRVPRGEGEGDEDEDEDDDDPDDGGSVAEFSSSLGQRQRSRIIRRARVGDIQVIVCSDGMARGMDLEGVGLVVNYDVPSHAKTYVHRVGRTARAGARGKAVTIAKKGQVKRFRLMREGVDGRRVRPEPSPPDESDLEALAGRYRRCLRELGEVLEAERAGELDPTAPVDAINAE